MAKIKFLSSTYIATWRKQRNITRRELGEALGYRGREYVKKIELGTMPITDQFARRFVEFKNKKQAVERRSRVQDSRYPLPPRLKILVKPRRCKICKEWFLFPSPRQRVCTDPECKREARRRA